MNKAGILRRLHEMVDQLESVPDGWFLEGIYPMHKVTFVRKGDGEGERITLVVGITDRDQEP